MRAELRVAVKSAAEFTKMRCGMKTAASRAVRASWPGKSRNPQAARVTICSRKMIPPAQKRAEPQKIIVQAEEKKPASASFPCGFSFSSRGMKTALRAPSPTVRLNTFISRKAA